jgi:hypothetical protein
MPKYKPKYRFLELDEVLEWENAAKELGVSKVARGSKGFLTAYKRAGSKNKLSEEWLRKRDGFIARHMAQVRNKKEKLFDEDDFPTRRHLALIMWAYSPFEYKLFD